MNTRIVLYVSFVLAIVALGISSVLLFGQIRERAATLVSQNRITAQQQDKYYVLYPQYKGQPYGDCFKGGKVIGYTIESECGPILKGDRWVKEAL